MNTLKPHACDLVNRMEGVAGTTGVVEVRGRAWHCSCGQVHSDRAIDWSWGDEHHTARRCEDYGDVILPPGAGN